jgi:hypothetical protein
MYKVAKKSGSNGYSDYDNCDCVLGEVPSNDIPRVGDIIDIDFGTGKGRRKLLVREIKRSINLPIEKYPFGEWIYVYVWDV